MSLFVPHGNDIFTQSLYSQAFSIRILKRQLHRLLSSTVFDENLRSVWYSFFFPCVQSAFLFYSAICFFLRKIQDYRFVPGILKSHHNVTVMHMTSFIFPALVFWLLLFRGPIYFINFGKFSAIIFWSILFHLSTLSSHSENVFSWMWERMKVFSVFLTFLSYFSSLVREFLSSIFQLSN